MASALKTRDGKTRLRHIEIGRSNGVEMQVLGGLEVGETIVLYPGERVSNGAQVKQRVVE